MFYKGPCFSTFCQPRLGLLYRLERTAPGGGDAQRAAQLAARAAAEMARVAKLSSWNPSVSAANPLGRFLTVAETMHGMAIGYDAFYDALNNTQRVAVEDGLYRNGVAAGLRCWEFCTPSVLAVPAAGGQARI